MSSQEFLLVLIMEVLDDKQPTDSVHQLVLVSWVELDRVHVLSIVTD